MSQALRAGGASLNVDERFADRYRIVRHLGDGGMGAVYLATDELLGEDVALKLAFAVTHNPEGGRERQRREVSLARRVTHPNVARVFDLGVSGGLLYITMEHVPGVSLRTRLKEGPLVTDEIVAVSHQVASALAAAHDAGVVHLDLKPSNVVIVDGAVTRAVLVDFGVSRALGERATGAGTLDYMAPEQLGDEAIGGAADVYALGLVLFELLTGERPFGTGESRGLARLTMKPPLLSGRVPAELASLVDACLARHPGDRPTSRTVERELARQLARSAGVDEPAPKPTVSQVGRVDATLTAELGLMIAEARTALAVVGDEARALSILDEVLRQAPGLDVAIASRAIALVQAWGDAFVTDDIADAAVVAVSDAIARASHLADAHLADALIADGSGDIAYAVRALRRALARDPLHAASHELLGFLALEAGVDDGTRLRMAWALDPARLASPVHIAREHFFAGRDDEGVALLDALDAERPTRESEVLRMRWCLWRSDADVARVLLRSLPSDGTPTREGTRIVLGYVTGDVSVADVRAFFEVVIAAPMAPKRRAFVHMIFVEVLANEDPNAALEHLLGAVQLPLADLRWLDACPALRPLRESSAFRIARATVAWRVTKAFDAAPVSSSTMSTPDCATDNEDATTMDIASPHR